MFSGGSRGGGWGDASPPTSPKVAETSMWLLVLLQFFFARFARDNISYKDSHNYDSCRCYIFSFSITKLSSFHSKLDANIIVMQHGNLVASMDSISCTSFILRHFFEMVESTFYGFVWNIKHVKICKKCQMMWKLSNHGHHHVMAFDVDTTDSAKTSSYDLLSIEFCNCNRYKQS